MTSTYRENNPPLWTGVNRPLTFLEADSNIYDKESRLTTLEQHVATLSSGAGIDYFSVTGNQFYVHLTNHEILGPYQLPAVTWNFTNPPSGAWLPSHFYSVNDVFNVGASLYVVNSAHTSGLSFDPGATDGLGHNLYTLMLQLYGIPVKTVTTTTFTPDISYANTYIRCTNSAGCTVTIPPDSSVNWVGFPSVELHVRDCSSAGTVYFNAGTGVTLNGIHSRLLHTAAVGAVVTLKRVDVNTWDVFGLLAQGSP